MQRKEGRWNQRKDYEKSERTAIKWLLLSFGGLHCIAIYIGRQEQKHRLEFPVILHRVNW